MKQHRFASSLCFMVALSCGTGVTGAEAADVDEILQVGQARTKAAQASQKVIDDLAEEARARFRDYRQVLKELNGLRVYNKRLEKQIEDQKMRIRDIEQATRNAVEVQRQIPSLTSRMIDSLEQFIELDVPFHLAERRNRIKLLRNNQDRSDVTTAEKFRQVMEAYKIENEYGRKIDTYKDTISLDGVAREVNVLRIGRIALMYQTTDGELTGAWNQREGRWEPLSRGGYRNAILKDLRIARKQAAIEIMKIPVPAPEVL